MGLAHQVFVPDGGEPSSYALFLHGILGSGGNLRTVARHALAGTGRGALLVDLRMHGRSLGMPGPHTVAQAAADLDNLADRFRITEIVGHSFGGKVALAFLERAAKRGQSLDRAFLLDSSPGERTMARGSEGTLAVLDVLDALPASFPSRTAFVEHLGSRAIARPIADWLAMNLARDGEAYRFGLNLAAIRALIDDYFATDLWPVVEAPTGAENVVVVAGGRSDVLLPEDRARVLASGLRNGGRTVLRVIPEAGHWVHVDAPEALVAILRQS